MAATSSASSDDASPSRKGYEALVPETPTSPREAHRGVIPRLAAGALLAACLCGSLALAASSASRGSRLRQGVLRPGLAEALQVKVQVFQGPGQCSQIEPNTDYILWGAQWGINMDHVPSAEMCCALCHGVTQCKSWTWIKDAGLDGCPSQCWLKGRVPDKKEAKFGYVSGIPPPRPDLPSEKGVSVRVTKAQYKAPIVAVSKFHGKLPVCSKIEVNTDYQSGQLLYTVDHVPSAAKCCEECHSVRQCHAWTWGKYRAEDTQNSVCYLKTAAPDQPWQKKQSPGSYSGVPGPRTDVPAFKMQDLQAVTVEKPGSAFCFSLMMPKGYEQDLLKAQYDLGAGIFGCDEWAVYSNASIRVAPGVMTAVVESDLMCELGGESYTALNTWIFIAVWRKVIEDRRFLYHDWTVKVDPDSVFFPSRLAVVLRDHKQAGYLNNCKFGLHGPIEVVSRRGMSALAADYASSFDGKSPARCVTELKFGEWGEDVFLDRCLSDVLGVPKEMDERLMCEAHCDCPDWFWCKNGSSRVSFHPFKRGDLYRQCMANALDEAQEHSLFAPIVVK